VQVATVETQLSRLELYIEILRSLQQFQSSNLRGIQEKTSVEQAFLEHAIIFLEKQGLIEKEYVGKEVVYSTTIRGERVASYFTSHTQEIPHEEINLT